MEEEPGRCTSWAWQLSHRIKTLEEIEKHINLTEDEREGIKAINGKGLSLNITPYYLRLVDPDNPDDPIRKTVIPTIQEMEVRGYELKDPLGEDRQSPVQGLVHRYPDRVLVLSTDSCATYCRYCTRRRLVGQKEKAITWSKFGEVVKYIKENEEIRDVLVSGGDPLVLRNERLEKILKPLYNIDHVEILRIGTKAPITMPQRITPSLCNMLKKYHPLWIMLNVVHPKEITPEVAEACNRLSKAGIPLGSQTVLLKGVNDDIDTMKELMHRLLKIRVRPYYIYQCDLAQGLDHFRTPIDTGIKILEKLRGWTTGFACPTFVIDTAGGKVPVGPNYLMAKYPTSVVVENYKGKEYEYKYQKEEEAD